MSSGVNKRKIINDPVYGFIKIPNERIYDVIGHPFFQRLRRIRQLGLTNYVYPSAMHTRFQHALGCMHLMTQAIEVLRSKGQVITEEEAEGVMIAILLHDIGHGPFSHTLEQSIVKGVMHEEISKLLIAEMNRQMDGALTTALQIFTDTYPKRFLHQLVSSQLDMDRLDYLNRDSFFTGVAEGVISSDRIIKMLAVVNDELVVEAKAIYSIEKFIISRRLMYWQVYYHKTVMAAEYMLINILRRAKFLAEKGEPLFATPSLSLYLRHPLTREEFLSGPEWLLHFTRLDDYDIVAALKVWMDHPDPLLSTLCHRLVNRDLYRIELQNGPFEAAYSEKIREAVQKRYNPGKKEMDLFVIEDTVANNAYNPKEDKILLLFRDGQIKDVSDASDQLNISMLSTTVSKHLLCYPKEISV
jgi:uncharacterized protein